MDVDLLPWKYVRVSMEADINFYQNRLKNQEVWKTGPPPQVDWICRQSYLNRSKASTNLHTKRAFTTRTDVN